ncbi:unnamed protein product [Adineta steineri]|uniref:Uncharacterized protein n=1 Tax=Adineta steineri TaxID=433720 RepID=A0A815N2E0_9BILA|nr:unnamed protein product [Adineta steineri]CAF3926532.1 unnamed protein product [Adineta steineri]
MINQHTFESLILTNTIVAAFCIVLLITFTLFIILFLVPSLRRRWLGDKKKDENNNVDISSLSRQPSFHHLTLGSSRLNPLFEPTTGTTTTTTTQFGTLFHPHATTATLLHPTIWTSMAPTSVVSSNPSAIQSVAMPSSVPIQPSTIVQKSPKKT